MKVKIKLKSKKDSQVLEIYNDIFSLQNGVAFFEINRTEWELVDFKQCVFSKKGVDYYEGDKVRVKGTKRVGEYETEIIKDLQGWTLKDNRTHFNNDRSFFAIIGKV